MRTVYPVLAVAAILTIAGCGGSSGGPASTTPEHHYAGATAPSDQAAATAAITTTWQTFFHTGTDPKAAAQLLENGSRLGAAIKVAAKIQRKQKITEDAKVLGVDFTSPTAATVTYNLLSHGSVLLPKATGQAVLQDGRWKVSQSTFCTLVQLGAGGTKIPGC
ncbi:MAG TPA: hypothetical protein VHE57_08925 [Mycobacteriales bacterium]|jgi:hypothetical protein|nr:hypothetical protein [Mycobacteriales bacterium]